MKLTNLKDYVENNNKCLDNEYYFIETFYNLVSDYLGMTGYEITKQDAQYIIDNGFLLEDFEIEDEWNILVR